MKEPIASGAPGVSAGNSAQLSPSADASSTDAIYLDTLAPTCYHVGYGDLGRFGDLGYEGGQAVVCKQAVQHGLSAHAPSSMKFELAGRFSTFTAKVGVADDAIHAPTKCTFMVRVDGLVSCEPVTIKAGQTPSGVAVDVSGARWMELAVIADRFEHAHSIWIDPQLIPTKLSRSETSETHDLIQRAKSAPSKSLTLGLHGNLGDQAAYTGLPYAYWKATGRRLQVSSDRTEFNCLWSRNPYCDLVTAPGGKVSGVRFEEFGNVNDWTQYRPQRVLRELTGLLATKENVCPALYYNATPREKRVVVCDQATWPNRRGYPHLGSLMAKLRDYGWEIVYLRNTEICPRQIFCEHVELKLNLLETIEFMSTVSLFVGYDSGLAHIAAGLNVPTIQFSGSTPPAAFKHRNCFYCLECCEHCCTDRCAGNCLARCEDRNGEILTAVERYFEEEK